MLDYGLASLSGVCLSVEEKISLLNEVLGKSQKSGRELLFSCPKCKHHKQKLSINVDKNAFKCWVCDFKGSSLKRLIRRYGSFKQRQEWEVLSGEIDISQPLEASLFGDLEIQEEIKEEVKLPKEFISLANKKLPLSSVEPLKYLTSRGISKQDIVKWKLGYCREGEYKNRIIAPSFDIDGNLNYFIARTYDPKNNFIKYTNPEVSKDIIFNQLYIDWKNDLTIVEGVFDAVKTNNAVPLLGSTLREDSKLFQEIVKHDTPIFIALDPDAEKKSFYLIKSLLLYDVEIYKIDVKGFEDVGSMTKEQFVERKNKAKPINSDSYVENIINWRM